MVVSMLGEAEWRDRLRGNDGQLPLISGLVRPSIAPGIGVWA